VLELSLTLDPTSPYARASDNKFEATLRASIQISDHSPEADYFGVVVVDFSHTDIAQPVSPKMIWQARRCHRDRGLPKVTVTKIEGEIGGEGAAAKVFAVPRKIGKLVPGDEIVATNRSLTPFSNSVHEWTIRGTTRESRLVFDLRLKAIRCSVEQGASNVEMVNSVS